MRLTPLDIRKQEFTRSFRGYESEEVQAFLQMVSSQWEDQLDEQRHLQDRLRDMETRLAHFERVEEALQEALQTARESSRKALENAEQKARLIVAEAEARAAEIKREAEQERHQIKRETAKLSGRRNEIVARLRAFLMSEMELLARFEGDDPIGFIKLLPAEEQRPRHGAERALPPVDEAPAPSKDSARSARPAPDAPDDDFDDVPPPVVARPGAAQERQVQRLSAEPEPRSPRVSWRSEDSAGEDQAEAEDAPSAGAYAYPDEAYAADEYDGDEYEQAAYEEDDFEEDDLEEDEDREPEDAAPAEPPPAPREEVRHGPGWTSRTVISMPAGQRPPPHGEPGERGNVAGSDEEIEKIRRILNDLD